MVKWIVWKVFLGRITLNNVINQYPLLAENRKYACVRRKTFKYPRRSLLWIVCVKTIITYQFSVFRIFLILVYFGVDYCKTHITNNTCLRRSTL